MNLYGNVKNNSVKTLQYLYSVFSELNEEDMPLVS
jgi:hypothetical protein